MSAPQPTPTLHHFFQAVLPSSTGYVPIFTRDPFGNLTQARWFAWPRERNDLVAYCLSHRDEDTYFSPFTYRRPPSETSSTWARKEHLLDAAVVWCDGDDCPVGSLKLQPDILVRTSPDHWQGYWRLDTDEADLGPFDWEALSRALYDAHKHEGMDSGWHLAKKMRVPGTKNCKQKYEDLDFKVSFEFVDAHYGLKRFRKEYPSAAPDKGSVRDADFGKAPEPDEKIAYSTLAQVNDNAVNDLFVETPQGNWSSDMYYLQCLLWENHVSLIDSFHVMAEAACNKFARDGRPNQDLWIQLNRDFARWRETVAQDVIDSVDPGVLEAMLEEQGQLLRPNAQGLFWSDLDFLHDGEEPRTNTFVDVFAMWARGRSQQSPREFNLMGSLALMSTVLSRYAKVPLTFGDMPLNLFMLVLGQTTQSRKTTSLSMARSVLMELAQEIGFDMMDEYIVPEDATPEAMNAWLAKKPDMSSLFARDEFQDLLSHGKAEGSYTRGLIPFLTKAYDGRIPGMLRRSGNETYSPSIPHFMSFYGTGIFSQTAQWLTTEKIESGFLPRCLVVTDDRVGFTPGADDVAIRRGADAVRDSAAHNAVLHLLKRAVTHWSKRYADPKRPLGIGDKRIDLDVSPEAFVRWQRFAYDITRLAADHPVFPEALFPAMERMSYSVLRVASLLSMVDCAPRVEVEHVVKAISLVGPWASCMERLVAEVSSTGILADIKAVETWLESRPDRTATMAQLMMKFQTRWDSLKRVQEVIRFAQTRGTLQELVTGRGPDERFLKYIG